MSANNFTNITMISLRIHSDAVSDLGAVIDCDMRTQVHAHDDNGNIW